MLRDPRSRAILAQVVAVALVLLVVAFLLQTTITNLRVRGIPLGFDFLTLSSRFVISEHILRYSPNDPYWWAMVVGIANTMFVSVLVVVFASVVGFLVGIGRLSTNPLVSASCRIWVELARNTPAIVLLIFLYALWWKILPPVQQALNPLPGVHLSMRGLFLPSVSASMSVAALTAVLAALLLFLAAALNVVRDPIRRLALLAAPALILAIVVLDAQFAVDRPSFTGTNFRGGLEVTPEIMTIVLGLTLYTAGFIAEIVRAGVLSVGKGQWEAAQSLGLSRRLILRLIVVPQMLRVIIPPLNSQYINTVKNSTLAIAVGYPDFLAIMQTIINKSSHAIEGVALILGVYLIINLTLSAAANLYNRRVGIEER